MLDNQPTDEEMNYRQQICRSTDGFQNCMDVSNKKVLKKMVTRKNTWNQENPAEIMRKWILY